MTEAKRPITLKPERLVVKDNALIMSSYALTVEEQRLILACIQKANMKKDSLKNGAVEIVLSVHEFAEIYGVSMNHAYRTLSQSSDKLWERSIKIDDEGVNRKIRWLQEKATYSSGKIRLVFSSVVSKHIREVVTTQTSYRIAQATQLRTQHSIRLFEIFQAVIEPGSQEGIWEVSLNDFKEILEIKGSYERWADLKKKVITPALKLINSNTSLKVDLEIAEKEGKRIIGVRFIIFESDQLSLSLT